MVVKGTGHRRPFDKRERKGGNITKLTCLRLLINKYIFFNIVRMAIDLFVGPNDKWTWRLTYTFVFAGIHVH